MILEFPKFRILGDHCLAGPLREMGMDLPFSRDADFFGMSDDEEGLFISGVIHKALAEVDEAGTVAAALAAMSMCLGLPETNHEETVVFRADHPFLFLIGDRVSGLILFLGRVADPRG